MEEDGGSDKITVTFGYQGRHGGSLWDDGIHSTIRRLVIYHSSYCICSVQIEYDNNGVSDWSKKHGGNDGYKYEVVLDYPEEYLISVHGYYSETIIKSLTLESNRKTYGPFGIKHGTKFSFPTNWGKIVGFHGRSGWYVDAIGFHVQPIQKNEAVHYTLGEYGGKGGSPWEDVFSRITGIVVNHELWIYSIQIDYEDKNGDPRSTKHGGNGGSQSEVKFGLEEHLISIHGYYSTVEIETTAIRSLTLETNTRSYGPFGVEDGTKFSFPAPPTETGVKIVGIHGRSGHYLNSIGLYALSIPK